MDGINSFIRAQGSKFWEKWGEKEECVKETFWGEAEGGMLVDFYSISLT